MKNLLPILGILSIAATGCSAGTGTTLPAQATSSPIATPSVAPMSSVRSTAKFTITVPAKSAVASNLHKPKYISTGTKSVRITLTTINGVATTALPSVVANITGTTTVNVPNVPVGNDTFSATVYDRINGSGDPLSTGLATGTIVANSTTPIPLTMDGIIVNIVLTTQTTITSGNPGTGTVSVNATDASGATIIGAFNNPISISASNGITFSSTILAPGPASFSYNGTAIAASTVGVTATAPGPISGSGSIAVVHTDQPEPSPSPSAGLSGTAASHILTTSWSAPELITTTISSLQNSIFSADLVGPESIAVDSAGNLYIADVATWGAGRVKIFTSTLAPSPIAGGTISGFTYPIAVAVDHSGNIYVGDGGNGTVKIFDKTGAPSPIAGGKISGLSWPWGIAVDNAGNIYVADDGLQALKIFDKTGAPSAIAGGTISTGLSNPFGVAVDNTGNIYVTNSNPFSDPVSGYQLGYVNVYTNSTSPGGVLAPQISGGTGTITANLRGPTGIAIDGAGNIYVANSGDSTIKIFTNTGAIATSIAGGTINEPSNTDLLSLAVY